MKCQILFSGKNKKNISKCRLLKILPRVLSVNLRHRVAALAAPCETCLFLRSSCACANFHPGLCSPFSHSVVSNDFDSEQ